MVEEGRAYIILNLTSSLALDLSSSDHKSVLGCTLNRGSNQKWVGIQERDGAWMIQSIVNAKSLSTADEPGPGVKLNVATFPTVRWQIKPGPPGTGSFSIFVPGSLLNVGLPGDGNVPSGTPVELQAGTIQAWKFEAQEL